MQSQLQQHRLEFSEYQVQQSYMESEIQRLCDILREKDREISELVIFRIRYQNQVQNQSDDSQILQEYEKQLREQYKQLLDKQNDIDHLIQKVQSLENYRNKELIELKNELKIIEGSQVLHRERAGEGVAIRLRTRRGLRTCLHAYMLAGREMRWLRPYRGPDVRARVIFSLTLFALFPDRR